MKKWDWDFFSSFFPESLVFSFTSGSERYFKPLKNTMELLRNCVLTEGLLGLFRNKSYCIERTCGTATGRSIKCGHEAETECICHRKDSM